MGRSINKKYFLWLFLALFILPIQNDLFSQTENEEKVSKPKLSPSPTYYGYWNPYRRKLEFKNQQTIKLKLSLSEISMKQILFSNKARYEEYFVTCKSNICHDKFLEKSYE